MDLVNGLAGEPAVHRVMGHYNQGVGIGAVHRHQHLQVSENGRLQCTWGGGVAERLNGCGTLTLWAETLVG